MTKEDKEELMKAMGPDILKAFGIEPMKVEHATNPPQPAPVPVPTFRPQHEVLVDEFMEVDRQCQEMIQDLNTGKVLYKCMPVEGAQTVHEFMQKLVAHFNAFREMLVQQIEKRNAKLQEAAAAMRSAVMAGENFVRGPDGKATTLRYGPFEVNSKTSRGFNEQTLFLEVQKLGLFERLLEQQYIDSSSGETKSAVHQEYKIHYDTVKNWLREQNLEEILGVAYEEEEGTPAVTGPKPLQTLGEVDKTKKGKK